MWGRHIKPPDNKYLSTYYIFSSPTPRQIRRRVGLKNISKATLWQALSQTGNSPDPFTSDTKGRSSTVGGGAATLISADAVEAAERAFTVGVKRPVIAALENLLFHEQLISPAHAPQKVTVLGCSKSSAGRAPEVCTTSLYYFLKKHAGRQWVERFTESYPQSLTTITYLFKALIS